MSRISDLVTDYEDEAPEELDTFRGLFFVCLPPSQGYLQNNFFTLVLICCLFTRHGILSLKAPQLIYFFYSNILFNHCFYSFFTFYGYYYNTGRCCNRFVVGCDNCVSLDLTQHVADNNLLAGCTVDSYLAIATDN